MSRPWFSFSGVEQAACLDREDVDFFPESATGVPDAVAVCNTCPVRQPCLDMALGLPEAQDHGVLGGKSRRARIRMRQERR